MENAHEPRVPSNMIRAKTGQDTPRLRRHMLMFSQATITDQVQGMQRCNEPSLGLDRLHGIHVG